MYYDLKKFFEWKYLSRNLFHKQRIIKFNNILLFIFKWYHKQVIIAIRRDKRKDLHRAQNFPPSWGALGCKGWETKRAD